MVVGFFFFFHLKTCLQRLQAQGLSSANTLLVEKMQPLDLISPLFYSIPWHAYQGISVQTTRVEIQKIMAHK